MSQSKSASNTCVSYSPPQSENSYETPTIPTVGFPIHPGVERLASRTVTSKYHPRQHVSIMDRWLIRNTQPRLSKEVTPATSRPETSKGAVSNVIDDKSGGDILMEDVSPARSSFAHSSMKSVRWTPINHPWRRNSHNAALFDSPVPEGAYLTQHVRVHPSESSEVEIGEEDGGTEQAPVDDDDDPREEDDGKLDDENEPAQDGPVIDYTALQKTCADFFAASLYFLIDERLLTVASLYTNNEIVEKVNQLHYPPPSDSAYNNQYITARLCDSITRVAGQRGVAREVVKGELDRMRKVNGVFERQVRYKVVRRQEERARREVKKGQVGAGDGVGVNVEGVGVGGTGDKVVPEAGASTSPTKHVGGTLPYGLGAGFPAREPVVEDSDEDDEEL